MIFPNTQGSVLVPIFFLVYINDISYSVPPEVSTKLFADDLKSYVSVAHGKSTVAFSTALDELTKWSNALHFM